MKAIVLLIKIKLPAKETALIVLDFAKAFDKVPHKRLTLKLKYYGISGPILHWLTAFLTDRTQRVLLDGSSSDTVPVSSGVPQGTGLVLFSSYFTSTISHYQHVLLPLDYLVIVYCTKQ